MKLIKKIAAGILLTIGVPIVLMGAVEGFNSDTSPEDREGALAALFLFGVPATGLGGWLVHGLYQQDQQQKQALKDAERDRLQSTFFALLEADNGYITVLRFAIETQLSGEEAKQFLDQKALEFDATFEADEKGGVSYHFQL